jgi:predicted permease
MPSRVLIACFAWLHRRVLALYPARFRARFGVPMAAATTDALAARAREAGPAAVIADGARAIGDAVRGVAPARAAAARDRLLWPAPARPPLARRAAVLADSVAADGRLAVRTLRRSPIFGVSMIAVLALGLGATTAIYAVVRGVLWQPLPYHEPERLVMIWHDNLPEHQPRHPISPADFHDFRRAARSFTAIEALYAFLLPMRLQTASGIEIAQGSVVTPGLLRLLGREALLGRTFADGETRDVVVISYAYWQRRFGGDPQVVGRAIPVIDQVNALDNRAQPKPARIIGVMPADFVFPYRTMLGPSGFSRASDVDFWLPLAFEGPRLVESGVLSRQVRLLAAVGRLKPGTSLELARAELATASAQIAEAFPATNRNWTATVVPLIDQTVGGVAPMLLAILAGVAVLLAMTCVNLANLLLARGIGRAGEAAVRAALGAGRGRLIQQALVESLVLGVTGGLAALAVGWWALTTLLSLAPADLPRLHDVRLDAGVVAFTLAAAVACALAIGGTSSLAAIGFDLPAALRAGRTRGVVGGRRGLRSALVVTEIALAVVLTAGAGLLARSFVRLLDVDPGFKPEALLTLQMNIPDAYDTPAKRIAYYDAVHARLEALPGVRAVGGTTRLPLGSTSVMAQIDVEHRPVEAHARPEVEMRRALHDFFPAMGIPLIEGRLFAREDGPDAPRVALLNSALATRLFGRESPLGRRVRLGGSGANAGPWLTVVGVVGNVRHLGLEIEPAPEIYINFRQGPPVAPFLALRVAGDPAALANAVRAAILEVDQGAAVFDVKTMMQVRSASVGQRRFTLTLAAAFGTLALLLAGVGVYGVMALVVAERTPEVGVRLALGARPAEIFRLVLRESWRLAAVGVAAGLVLAAILAPALATQLYAVPALDPATFLAVALVLFGVAGLAAVVPARSAMRVDPIAALRADRG